MEVVGGSVGCRDWFVLIHSIQTQYYIIRFPKVMKKPLLVHKVWADLRVCFLFQTFFFFLELVTFCFLTPPFAQHACPLPRAPENRMEAHKSLTCFRWPYKSYMTCLINLGRLLWPSYWGSTTPAGSVQRRGRDPGTTEGTTIAQELSKPRLHLTPHFQAVSQRGESF